MTLTEIWRTQHWSSMIDVKVRTYRRILLVEHPTALCRFVLSAFPLSPIVIRCEERSANAGSEDDSDHRR